MSSVFFTNTLLLFLSLADILLTTIILFIKNKYIGFIIFAISILLTTSIAILAFLLEASLIEIVLFLLVLLIISAFGFVKKGDRL